MTRSADKDLAADYPLERQAYRITVQAPGDKVYTRTVQVKPEANQDLIKQRIRRIAHEFGAEIAGRLRLNEAQAREMTIKVDQIPMEQYRQRDKTKPGKGRAGGLER